MNKSLVAAIVLSIVLCCSFALTKATQTEIDNDEFTIMDIEDTFWKDFSHLPTTP